MKKKQKNNNHDRLSFMDVEALNKTAWDEEVKRGNYWSRIIEEKEIEKAISGSPDIQVTPERYVPLDWIRSASGKDIILLAGAGGQQTALMSAYGANVTTLDQSDGQLEQDRKALNKYHLKAKLINSDMRHTPFASESFDYAINPVSLNFVDNIIEIYKEVHRILKPEGIFIFGIANPILYTFDEKCVKKRLKIKYTLPYSDVTSISKRQLQKKIKTKDTIEFSHTLNIIIGDLLHAGFIIEDFYSDKSTFDVVDSFVQDAYLAFKARRM